MCGEDLDLETCSPADLINAQLTSPWRDRETFTGKITVTEEDVLHGFMVSTIYGFIDDRVQWITIVCDEDFRKELEKTKITWEG